jgi:hypothetical protein
MPCGLALLARPEALANLPGRRDSHFPRSYLLGGGDKQNIRSVRKPYWINQALGARGAFASLLLVEECADGRDCGGRLLFHQPVPGVGDDDGIHVGGDEAQVVRHSRSK